MIRPKQLRVIMAHSAVPRRDICHYGSGSLRMQPSGCGY